LGEVVSIDATPAEIPTDQHVPILYENVDPTTIKKQNFIGTTVVHMLRFDKTAATCSRV
jgi:peptide methionine sulfoxide reductase MsrA